MTEEELIKHIERLIEKAKNPAKIYGTFPEICQFLSTYSGPKNEFLLAVKQYNPREYSSVAAASHIINILLSFLDYVKNGLHQGISIERKAQLDVVSDFLGQAQILLESKEVHPASPAMLIGATLEEFLRTWIENENLSLKGKKPCLDSYIKTLREEEKITKQDVKDLNSWAGIRNHAAHGEWSEIEDKNRIRLMLEGINLFIRQYTVKKAST